MLIARSPSSFPGLLPISWRYGFAKLLILLTSSSDLACLILRWAAHGKLEDQDLGRLTVDHGRSLPDPLLLGHRLVADHVLAGDVLDLPGVAPVSRVAVLEPEDLSRDVRRHALDDRQRCFQRPPDEKRSCPGESRRVDCVAACAKPQIG
jgi:hypothetical protein